MSLSTSCTKSGTVCYYLSYTPVRKKQGSHGTLTFQSRVKMFYFDAKTARSIMLL